MGSNQNMRLKSEIHSQNVHKRGSVKKSLVKAEDNTPVGPILLGVFLFVVIGSAIFQILQSTTQ